MDAEKLHVAILSSPGMGHLVPVLILGNRLISHHNLHVTIIAVTTDTSAAESQLLRSLTGSGDLNIVKVPLVDVSALLHPEATVVTRLAVMMREARPGIWSAISAMNHHPDVLIADLFSTESFPIADEFHMQKYVYSPCSAWFAALTTYCHVLDKEVKGQYVDQKEPLRIPGCKPVRPEDVADPMLDRNNQQYVEYVRMGLDFSSSDGILLNTCREMECTTLDALKHNEILRAVVKAPVYDVGPLTRKAEPFVSEGDVAMEWLDSQPDQSVLYVSFGSGGTLSAEQITELAWGLELSRQRFVWVVRPPVGSNSKTDGSFFTSGTDSGGPPDYFPEGFLNRIHEVGFVITEWAPQVKILNHRSVGGFMSHCGMNSTLESIASGVPMIAWPLYAEQRLNATIVTEELGIAVRAAVLPTKKVVGREEIEKMVRTLMESDEGKRMRDKVKVLKDSAEEALSGNGSSYINMCEFVFQCQMKKKSCKSNGKQ